MSQTKISFQTLGCRLNQSETTVIERTFKMDGYRVVDFHTPADLVVINTCTVTEGGDADTRRLINKAARINPQTRIALIGCQAQVQKENISKHPNVKWVVGNARKMDLKTIIQELERETTAPVKHVIAPPIERKSFTQPLAAIDANHTRANMKIQDGCDFFCSFCEIPYARGRARSREFSDVVKEATALARAGHKEVVITGINVGTYRHKGRTILHILDELEKVDGLNRIRVSSIEPTTIPFELIERMADNSKLCPYLHVPLQSASNEILTAMKRKYTFEEFLEFVSRAKKAVKNICIGTDVIVGFPGETEASFQKTQKRLREAPVDYFHVFSYSQRHMAKSAKLQGTVAAPEIKNRSRALRELSRRKQLMFYQSLTGSVQQVLFEQKKDSLWAGLSDNYARVFVPSSENLENKLLPVYVENLKDGRLVGSVI